MKPSGYSWIVIEGAREHNLKDVNVRIPHGAFTVVTGVSGSGKSSLVFDVLYQEAYRRYLETYSVYSRQFITGLKRPAVRRIEGLSPAIAIRQDLFSYSPRSTVGTFSEIYDFLRLLYARVSVPVHPKTGKRLRRQSIESLVRHILRRYTEKKISILSVMVRGRRGHYQRQLERWLLLGYRQVRIDGKWYNLVEEKPEVARYHRHDIDLLIDTLRVSDAKEERVRRALQTALTLSPYQVALLIDWDRQSEEQISPSLFVEEVGGALPTPEPDLFSFNSPRGWCPQCQGLGVALVPRWETLLDPEVPVVEGGFRLLRLTRNARLRQWLEQALIEQGYSPEAPAGSIPQSVWEAILSTPCPFLPSLEDENNPTAQLLADAPVTLWEWFLSLAQREERAPWREWARQFMEEHACPTCEGRRLRPETLYFQLEGVDLGSLALRPLTEVLEWLTGVDKTLRGSRRQIARELLRELRHRLEAVCEIGLGYLHLHRTVRSLSGGEAQRLRLATQLGSPLTGILYILDEPTIGMHPAEIPRLIRYLHRLKALGNTVVVVEHDLQVMASADYLIELGPGGGTQGGKVVNAGWKNEFLQRHTLTAQYLLGTRQIVNLREQDRVKTPRGSSSLKKEGKWLVLEGATGHNLQDVTLRIPLGKFVCVAGVSGSGKSTLILDTLYPALARTLHNARMYPLPYRRLTGTEYLRHVHAVDQEPIGQTPRSVPITYIQAFTAIRTLFAQLPEARARGLTPSHFSFNTKAGQCPACQGMGYRVIQMRLLPDVQIPCEVCRGQRYRPEVLHVRYQGKNIAEVLALSFSEACELFRDHPLIARRLQFVVDVGLGYLHLGQPSPTLSGGEAQRIKIARELTKSIHQPTLYILDEPTTGLHAEDVVRLLKVFHQLVEKGHTVLVIEHHVDVLRNADWIIELGPGAAAHGGRIIAEGTPEQLQENPHSIIGRYLREEGNFSCVSVVKESVELGT